MKKAVIGLASLLLAAGLTGCGGKQPSPGDVAGYDAGEIYISMWVHTIEDTPEGEAYKQSVEAFNEQFNGRYFADIEFIPRNDSGGGYSGKINASVMSVDLPDVITVDGPNVAAYAANGIIQPLAPLNDAERGVYLDSILEQGTYNDTLYALGAMESSVGLYYNKAILAEAGIEVPDAAHPWTWTEFTAILEQLKPLMDAKNGYYTLDEIEQKQHRLVVQQLKELMILRNTHPAFSLDGTIDVRTNGDRLTITRSCGTDAVTLYADLTAYQFNIEVEQGIIYETV